MGYSSLAGTLFEKREKVVYYFVIKYTFAVSWLWVKGRAKKFIQIFSQYLFQGVNRWNIPTEEIKTLSGKYIYFMF